MKLSEHHGCTHQEYLRDDVHAFLMNQSEVENNGSIDLSLSLRIQGPEIVGYDHIDITSLTP
jgi:hypothetical protein